MKFELNSVYVFQNHNHDEKILDALDNLKQSSKKILILLKKYSIEGFIENLLNTSLRNDFILYHGSQKNDLLSIDTEFKLKIRADKKILITSYQTYLLDNVYFDNKLFDVVLLDSFEDFCNAKKMTKIYSIVSGNLRNTDKILFITEPFQNSKKDFYLLLSFVCGKPYDYFEKNSSEDQKMIDSKCFFIKEKTEKRNMFFLVDVPTHPDIRLLFLRTQNEHTNFSYTLPLLSMPQLPVKQCKLVSNKMRFLEEVIEFFKNKKIAIFSNYAHTIEIISSILTLSGRRHVLYSDQNDAVLNSFDIFLFNTKSVFSKYRDFSVIVFFEFWWNPSREQDIKRIFEKSPSNKVIFFELFYAEEFIIQNTMEKKQKNKNSLINDFEEEKIIIKFSHSDFSPENIQKVLQANFIH